MIIQQPLNWTVGYSDSATQLPSTMVPATVPGAVNLDIAAAENYEPWWYGQNWKQFLWMEDKFWTYETCFARPQTSPDQQVRFISKGIDYAYAILLNDECLYQYEGMFKAVDLDLTDKLKDENVLRIVINPAPKRHNESNHRSQADNCCKPAVSYGWDWHPRLIPLGIWDDTFLEIRPKARLTEVNIQYTLNENLDRAQITVTANLENASGQDFTWSLADPAGSPVIQLQGTVQESTTLTLQAELEAVQLWWPHSHGTPSLYQSTFSLGTPGQPLDEDSRQIGFRTVKLVMAEGAWKEYLPFPKGRNSAPITLEINGKHIFAKGSNWVPPEVFPGTITAETYKPLLEKAVETNLNILRIWGGGIVNKDSFYQQCDQMGILVWSEFPLACNNYRDVGNYIAVLKEEATAILKRLRHHPSIAIWCGGNELFNAWSRMTDQSKALRLLNALCLEYVPEIPFLPTSPVEGMGHGPYGFADALDGTELLEKMAKARKTAYSECSTAGPAMPEILREFIPENELFPPQPGATWEDHHAFRAWDASPSSHLEMGVVERYFGPSATLQELTDRGLWIQNAGITCLYEEGRRQKPYCSMVLNWCFNEPWPVAAGGSVICWPCRPKPALDAMRLSCRPVLASARLPKFKWKPGEVFECDLYLLNDTFEAIAPCTITASLEGDTTIELLTWHCQGTAYNANATGPSPRIILPEWHSRVITLHLSVSGKPEWNSAYKLPFEPSTKGQKAAFRAMNV